MNEPPPPKRTMFAQQAVDFSDYFDMMFDKVVVVGDAPRRVKLASPDGISTSGGKQAVQHLLLKPEIAGADTITVGWIDRSKGMAQLRSFEFLAEQHRQRGKLFNVDPTSYQEFFDKTKKFLDQERLPVRVESSPVSAAAPARSEKSGLSPLVWIAVILFILFCLAVVGTVALYFIMG
jgi:hypothetical protein